MPNRTFRYGVTTLIHDVDAAGVMFFAHYFRYAHDAYEAFMSEIGFPLNELIKKGWMLPLVHSEADFKHPARHGDEIAIELRLMKIGKSSFTIGYVLKIAQREIAKLSTTHVSLGGSGREAERLPTELQEALSQYLMG
jgi:1,4-dihydroxy-2-naphthoyl-CoA hydrolase